MNNKSKYLKFTQTAMLIAIMIVMMLVPFLGFVPITPAVKATTMHIPVIIGAVLMGPWVGAFLGCFFGLTSFISNSFLSPTVFSFLFTPLYSVGEVHGNFYSLVICFVPRILIGVVAGLIFKLLERIDKTKVAACIISAIAGSFTNTILVTTGIFLFFGEEYAAAKNIAMDSLLKVLAGLIYINGVAEAVIAAILVPLVARPLLKLKNY